jgi:Skp family chaperone for outer membrane proteins
MVTALAIAVSVLGVPSATSATAATHADECVGILVLAYLFAMVTYRRKIA